LTYFNFEILEINFHQYYTIRLKPKQPPENTKAKSVYYLCLQALQVIWSKHSLQPDKQNEAERRSAHFVIIDST
jgi:hypothetical protein